MDGVAKAVGEVAGPLGCPAGVGKERNRVAPWGWTKAERIKFLSQDKEKALAERPLLGLWSQRQIA
jgi:hypothetical protein